MATRRTLREMQLDPTLTFQSFVVGPANRLAAAAARRAAEAPGTSYNPLFIYSPSGLGKTHILEAIAHYAAQRQPDLRVLYQPVEQYLNDLEAALSAGDREGLRERYEELDLLLMDDVQFLAGRREAQEMLLRTFDALSGTGGQIVLASDRPPGEIDDLDDRLLSRFSGGLIVDIAIPEYETRVAIARRKADERRAVLAPGVAEAVARFSFGNVRELQGALNRILAVQELEGRTVSERETEAILGGRAEPGVAAPSRAAAPSSAGEFASFLEEVSSTLARVVTEDRWRAQLEEAAQRWEREGYQPARLRAAAAGDTSPADLEALLQGYGRDVERLRELAAEVEAHGLALPEETLSALRDPDRLAELQKAVAAARELARPFPPVPPEPTFEQLPVDPSSLAVSEARRFVLSARPPYSPFYVVGRGGTDPRDLLVAAAQELLAARPGERVALCAATEFGQEFIRALEAGLVDPWRARWRGVDVLFVHGAEALGETERTQDEFFHLFDELTRRGARIAIGAGGPPSELKGIGERLRSRFEGGLVVEFEPAAPKDAAALATRRDDWFRSPEKLVWEWPEVSERIVEELE
ncbi:MAG: ATP-binding protein [Gemmatimonadetes bacterium]|nr:ATP-binding protein [Gemmatimonadota bacterium]